jgi:hypothetical protein
METVLDLDDADRVAFSLGGERVELAGATIGAVAMYEFTSLQLPFDAGHSILHRTGMRLL